MKFNTIITGDDPNTVNRVKRFLQSTADVDGNNSGVINVYKNKYRHVVLPNLATDATGAHDSTKTRWWFLACITGDPMGWNAYLGVWEPANKKNPATGNNGEDFHNDNWFYGTRGSYGIRVVSGRGLIGSNPTT